MLLLKLLRCKQCKYILFRKYIFAKDYMDHS